MGAPKGNQFWKARSSHGRNPTFSDPKKLLDACQQYFQWVQDNPLKEEKAFAYQGDVDVVEMDKMRAMSLGGLCIFLGISRNTWVTYRKQIESRSKKQKELSKDFLRVTGYVEEAIYNQKFEGASADMLNANIIARDLGLKDRKETDVTITAASDFLAAIVPTKGLPSERNN